MPIMWFATDGPRPNSQSGPGVPITVSEVAVILGSHKTIYAGSEAPSINAEQPSESLKNVVIEVESNTEVCSQLPKIGFYVVIGLRPTTAKSALDRFRSSAQKT